MISTELNLTVLKCFNKWWQPWKLACKTKS